MKPTHDKGLWLIALLKLLKGLSLLLGRKEVAAGAHDVIIAVCKYIFVGVPIMVALVFVVLLMKRSVAENGARIGSE